MSSLTIEVETSRSENHKQLIRWVDEAAQMCQPERVHLNGQPGLATYLSNDSPLGGQETDWMITTLRPEGLVSFVCVAPQSAYEKYDKTFNGILDSVRFTK